MKNSLFLIISFSLLLLHVGCKTASKPSSSTKDKTLTTESNDANNENKVIEPPCSLPLVPEYPEGDDALYKFINDHLQYPEEAKKNNISGHVLVSFTVLLSGEITDVKVQQGIGYGCDEEAVRIMKLMPKWKPGKVLNKETAMSYSLSIAFTLNK